MNVGYQIIKEPLQAQEEVRFGLFRVSSQWMVGYSFYPIPRGLRHQKRLEKPFSMVEIKKKQHWV